MGPSGAWLYMLQTRGRGHVTAYCLVSLSIYSHLSVPVSRSRVPVMYERYMSSRVQFTARVTPQRSRDAYF
jgi:hypothetical protein